MINREQIKFVITSISGNILEWYDFALYGYFATIIAKLFFPAKDPFVSLMLTFGVFASGFITRPLGGIIFGHIGDKYGRRMALVISIILIIFPTTLIGLLPTYNSAGYLAPILLIFLRQLQGIAVSGELTGAGTFLIECAPEKNKCFYGSLIMCSTYLGLLLGAGISVLVTSLLMEEQVLDFGWRIPFLISFIFGVFSLALRIKCKESPIFNEMSKQMKILKSPILIAIKKYPIEIALICLASSALAVAIYLLIGYFPSFFVSKKFMSFNDSMYISSVGLLTLSLFVPIMGIISDSIGSKKVFYFGATSFILFGYPIFYLASRGSIITSICSVMLISFFLSAIASTLMYTISSVFPSNIRYSGVSIGYNISMSVFGGTTPIVAMYMTDLFKSELAPTGYLVLCGLATTAALFFIRKNEFKNEGVL